MPDEPSTSHILDSSTATLLPPLSPFFFDVLTLSPVPPSTPFDCRAPGRHLRAGIQRNKSLLEIDLRYTDIEPEDEIAITETLTTNVADARRRAGYDDMLARL